MRLPERKASGSLLLSRLGRGWDVRSAVTTAPHERRAHYVYKGRLLALSDLLALPECTASRALVYKRLGYGWSVEDAVRKENVGPTLPPTAPEKRRGPRRKYPVSKPPLGR